MTVQELIDKLQAVKDKSAEVLIRESEWGEGDYVYEACVSFTDEEDEHTGNYVILSTER